MWTGNRQSGGIQARQAKLSVQPAAPVYITRKIAYYDFLGEAALAAIEAQASIAQRKEAMPDAWY
jgi:trimethylamine:corrinoid methyltransferase-like protein